MPHTLIIPAPVDPHVHLRGLDWAHKGTFTSETGAALAGGYAAVLDMPNTPPATVTPEALNLKMKAMAQESVSDWGVYYGAGLFADAAVYAYIADDICGIKMYCNATTGDLLIEDSALREAHFAAWKRAGNIKPIAVHAEGETVAQILALTRKYDIHTHFCHISTAEEIGYLQQAKADGLPVSIGVTPHHLYLTEDDVPRLGAFGLMKPALKTRHDQQALWAAVSSGLVDVIESDHAPHTLEEKSSERIYYGVPGLETTIPLLCLALHEKRITEQQLVKLVATNPRRIFHIAHDVNTYTAIDPDATYEIQNKNLFTACGWSPFSGMQVRGKITGVWIRGTQVFNGEKIRVPAGFGRNIWHQPL